MKPFDPSLLRLVPESRAAIAGLAGWATVQGLAAIAQAFAVSALVVAVVEGEAWGMAAGATVAVFTVRGMAAGLAEAQAARAGVRVSGGLRRRLLDRRLLDRRLAGSLACSSPDSAQLLTLATQGATSVEPYVARYLPTLVAAAMLPPAAVLAMLWLDWRTALIPILTVPLLPLFAALIGAATAEATQRRWRTLARLSGHFLDVMRGLPTLVNYGRAHRQTDAIREVSHDHRRATVATLRLAFLSSAALELLATLSVAVVAVWVGIQLAEGRMSLGLAMPLILLAPEAYWPLRRVGAEFHNAADGAAALGDIAALLDPRGTPSPESVAASRAAAAPGPVRLEHVTFAYGDAPPVVRGFSVTLPSPGLTVVTGPTGVGKTTLLELVAGLRLPDAGRVTAPPAHLVTQRPFLAPASLRANLLLGVRLPAGPVPAGALPAGVGPAAHGHAGRAPAVTDHETDARLIAALDAVGLDDLLNTLPDGLDTLLGDDGFGLSAGQRARVALARAVLADPPLLLLDEPTAHLDAAAEERVNDLIARLAQGRAVVAVTHRDGLLSRADRQLTLAKRP